MSGGELTQHWGGGGGSRELTEQHCGECGRQSHVRGKVGNLLNNIVESVGDRVMSGGKVGNLLNNIVESVGDRVMSGGKVGNLLNNIVESVETESCQ